MDLLSFPENPNVYIGYDDIFFDKAFNGDDIVKFFVNYLHLPADRPSKCRWIKSYVLEILVYDFAGLLRPYRAYYHLVVWEERVSVAARYS